MKVVLDKRDVLSMTLLDLMKRFMEDFSKIIFIFVTISLLSISVLRSGAVYTLDVDPRVCAYELKCEEKGFVFFVDILATAIRQVPNFQVTGWEKIETNGLWYDHDYIETIDISKINEHIRFQILFREKELQSIYQDLIDEEIDVQVYKNDMLNLKRRVLTLKSIKNIIAVENIETYGPLDHYLGLSFFIFLMASIWQLVFMPLLVRGARVFSK